MKTPGISFVIPVYNMERYLPRVIQCLKVQTMPGFEAIFVNDGSRDNSLAICKRAASEDPRFRIIDQPNKGVAKARNAALDAARGEYVCFLDPDDWVEPDMAKVLYELHWIDEQEMLDMTALAQSSPGAIAVNAAILVGWHGLRSWI